MKKRILFIIITAILIVSVFAGCSSTQAPASYEKSEKNTGYPVAVPPVTQGAAASEAPAAPAQDAANGKDNSAGYSSAIVVPDTTRKIILTQTIVTNTKNFDADLEKLNGALKTAGGYLQESNIQGTKPMTYEDTPRTAYYVFRVPKQNAEAFVKTALTAGEVVSNQSSGQDITGQYMDTETRLKTLRTRLDRLEDLLSKAGKMEDIVTLEKEISDVTYEIESLEGQKRGWDNLVEYVTIQMRIQEVNVLNPSITEKKNPLSFGEQLGNGFYAVLNGVVDFFKTLFLIIVAGSPIIVPVAIIVVIILLSVRAGKKKRMSKTDQL